MKVIDNSGKKLNGEASQARSSGPKVIGLTGGVASGKSTVSQILRDEGVPVVDADQLAREVVGLGSFGLAALVQVFGPAILQPDGSLNRSVLGEKIFSDLQARLVVERITHPLIQWRAAQEIQALIAQRHHVIVYDAALILEKNLASKFHRVAVVHVPEEMQLQRLVARDKISQAAAKLRLQSQWPMEKKMAAASDLIDNSGSREQTRKQVVALISTWRKK